MLTTADPLSSDDCSYRSKGQVPHAEVVAGQVETTTKTTTSASHGNTSPLDVFILAGQSNMVGWNWKVCVGGSGGGFQPAVKLKSVGLSTAIPCLVSPYLARSFFLLLGTFFGPYLARSVHFCDA